MNECPDCDSYNTACTLVFNDDGDLLYADWRCGDCGAEWIEEDEIDEDEDES